MKIIYKKPNMRIFIVEDQFIEAHDLQLIVEKCGYQVIGMARSVSQALEFLKEAQPDLVLLDIFLKGNGTGIDLAKKLHEWNIGYIYISANSGKDILDQAKQTQPYGFIVKPFREQDVLTTLEIAAYRHQHSLESKWRQKELLKQSIARLSGQCLKIEEALFQFGVAMQAHIPFDYLEIAIIDGKSYRTLGLLRKNFEEYQLIDSEKTAKISGLSLAQLAQMQSDGVKNYNGILHRTAMQTPEYRQTIMQNFGIRSFVSMPVSGSSPLLDFSFYSRQPAHYEKYHFALLQHLQPELQKLVESTKTISAKLPAKKSAPEEAASTFRNGFHDMAGKSGNMYRVFDYIKKVAPSDTSVLILGESGTGKEKVARSIHDLSLRKDKPLVIINCGAIPEHLSESLLFGHEKGAFTGALDKRIGKFEQAEGGTVFLDEIGEMPNEMQVKLLRVLQEREIERIGSRLPQKVDIRIIAATNRNLEEEVAAGRFRLDLYYRLHVFPITVPPLRDRKEDIPDLAAHFVAEYCAKMGRPPLLIASEAINDMMNYHWPGNIRELENSIHRSILLADGDVINEIVLSNPQGQGQSSAGNHDVSLKTIQENERDYITFILGKCKGKISGSGGAAEILNIPPSTLNSRIKKLGINH